MANQDRDWKDGFLFLANDLALDFLNTRPVVDGKALDLLPDFPALLRWFVAAGLLDTLQARALVEKSAAQTSLVRQMHEFREKLRVEITRWEKTGSVSQTLVEELNEQMAAHPMRLRLARHGREWSTSEYLDARRLEDLFAPLAVAAARLLAAGDHARVRQCDACVLHFHDTSKKGTRRWCSMQICGNREKVAAYARRQRAM